MSSMSYLRRFVRKLGYYEKDVCETLGGGRLREVCWPFWTFKKGMRQIYAKWPSLSIMLFCVTMQGTAALVVAGIEVMIIIGAAWKKKRKETKMPPQGNNNEMRCTEDLNDKPIPTLEKLDDLQKAGPRKYEIVYKNIFVFGYLHAAAFYGLYLCFIEAKWLTILFAYLSYIAATIGVTAGAHRLWSHKAFKAKLPLQILLMVFLSIANQRATHWVRDHRVHHKYSDTDADPHNASRGFFYSHLGWLFVKKHPEVKKRGKLMDLSDLYSNPVLMFQHRYAKQFIPVICFVIPTLIPMLLWGETFNTAWHLVIMRYVFNFHIFFLVNSAAHIFGNKPYDKNILSSESKIVSLATFGEGFHNYHHVFPWDYRSAELGNTWFNYTKLFIDMAATVGWAYDLKTVPDDIVRKRALRSGDGSHRSKVEKEK